MSSLFEQLVRADRTEGRLGVALVTQPPGVATPLHRHTRESEVSHLLDRTATNRVGEECFVLSEGSFISHLAPRYGPEVLGPPIPA